jgi:excisionase family DNA binding protein
MTRSTRQPPIYPAAIPPGDVLEEIKLRSPEEVGELVGLSGTTIRRLCKSGAMPCRRIGVKGVYKLTLADVRAWLDSRSTCSTPAPDDEAAA